MKKNKNYDPSKGTRHIKTHEKFMEEVEKDWAIGKYDRFYPPDEAESRFAAAFENLINPSKNNKK